MKRFPAIDGLRGVATRFLGAVIPPSGGQRFAALDGLRGVAILSITAFHVWAWAGCPATPFAPFLALGATGPSLFFVISGFVLYLCYIHNPNPREFYLRRAWRLLPPYWIAVMLWWLILPGRDGWQLFTHLMLVHNCFHGTAMGISAPLWFIAPLAQFYLVFPLVAAAMRRDRWLTIGSFFALSAAAQLVGSGLWKASLAGHIGNCVCGMFAADYFVRHKGNLRAPLLLVASVPLFICAAAVIPAFAHPPVSWGPMIFLGPAWALLVLAATGWRSCPYPLVIIGQASYSIYLYNLAGPCLVAGTVAQFALTLLVGFAAYPLEQAARHLKEIHRIIGVVKAVSPVAGD